MDGMKHSSTMFILLLRYRCHRDDCAIQRNQLTPNSQPSHPSAVATA